MTDKGTQVRRFADVARGLECDENEGAFEAKLRQIAKVKPKPTDEAEAKNDKAPE